MLVEFDDQVTSVLKRTVSANSEIENQLIGKNM